MTDNQQCREASPEECRRVIEEEQGCRILDVRRADEYRQGHLESAVNIDVNAPDFKEKIAELDRDQPYVVYCKAGVRGAKAMEILKRAGFSRVYNLSGGYENWIRRGLPVQR